MIRYAFVLIVGYACAAAVSSHVSMDLAQTDWLNIWTYFWWVMAAPFLFAFWVAIIGGVAAWWVNR